MGGNRNQLFKAVMLGVARQPGDPAVGGAPEGTCAAQPLAPDNRAVPPGSQVGSTLAPPSCSHRGWPRIRRMIAAQAAATMAGPNPKGMISAPFPDSDQPLPDRWVWLRVIARSHINRPVASPAPPTEVANHRSFTREVYGPPPYPPPKGE